MALGQLVVRLGLDAADFTQGMSKAEADAYKLGESIGQNIKSAALGAAAALGTIALAAAGAFKLVNDQVEAIASFQQLSEKIGDTAENLASLKKASDVSGTSMDSIAAASVKLTAALSKTDEEGMGAANAIKALGLDFNAFKAMSPVDQIDAVSKAMAGFEDGANKTAVAVALWGKSGADMIPLLNDLAQGSERQITLTQDQIKAADDFSKAIARLTSDSSTLKQQLAAQLIPTLSDLLKGFKDVGTEAGNSAEKSKPFAGVMEFIRQEIKKTVADTFQAISAFKQFGVVLETTTNMLSKMPSGLLKFDMSGSIKALSEMQPKLDAITNKYSALVDTARKAGDLTNKALKSPLDGGFGADAGGYAPVKNQLAFSAIKTPSAKAGKAEKPAAAEKVSEAQRYLEQLEKQLQTVQKLTVEEKLQQDILSNKISGINPVIEAQLIGAAKRIDAEKARGEATKLAEQIARSELEETQRTYEDGVKARLSLEAEGQALRESVKTDLQIFSDLQTKYNGLVAAGVISQNTANLLIDKAKKAYESLTPVFLKFNELAMTGAESLSSGLADAIIQGKSLADVFKNVVKQLAAMVLKALLFKAINIGLNAIGLPGLPGKAVGGPVNQGKSYLVGEKGPELFTPNNSGKISTNAQTFKQQGGGSGGYTNVYNISAPGVSREEFTAGLNRSQAGAVSDVSDNRLRRRG